MGLMGLTDSSVPSSNSTPQVSPTAQPITVTPAVPDPLNPTDIIPAPVIPGLDVQPVLPVALADPNATTIVNNTDILDDLPIVKDPALERMAFDSAQYPQSTSSIIGYMRGHRVKVIYYRLNNMKRSQRSNIVDTPMNRHNIHTSLIRINDYELTLQDGWSFDFNIDTTRQNVTGSAYTYSQLNPLIGDIFLATVGDNKVGMFRVTGSKPGSWRSQSCFEITFYLFAYLTDDVISFLQAATDETLVFDKANFLGETASLLKEDKYIALETMRNMRISLAKYFFRKFYNQALGSFFRPDNGVYDPYLTKFVTGLCEYRVVKFRPRQLFAAVDLSFGESIWQRLLEPWNTAIADVCPFYRVNIYLGRTMDIGLTNIVNRPYMQIARPEPFNQAVFAYYVFSEPFYNGDYENMLPFEQFLYAAIKNRYITDTTTLINTYLNNYLSLTEVDQFYQIPVYLWMIDVAIDSIARVTPE